MPGRSDNDHFILHIRDDRQVRISGLPFNKANIQLICLYRRNDLLRVANRYLKVDLRILLGKFSKSGRQNVLSDGKAGPYM
ncbi:hypothetical protein D3C75_1313780 [compost metagenome]